MRTTAYEMTSSDAFREAAYCADRARSSLDASGYQVNSAAGQAWATLALAYLDLARTLGEVTS